MPYEAALWIQRLDLAGFSLVKTICDETVSLIQPLGLPDLSFVKTKYLMKLYH